MRQLTHKRLTAWLLTLVMALSLLCTVTGGSIAGAQAVAKSFPDYFERLAALGVPVTEDTP